MENLQFPKKLQKRIHFRKLTKNNVQEQETPVVARRGRQRKNVAQVESVISQNATNEDSLLKANNSNTEQMLVVEKGTPSVIRRGRARKKVPEAEIDTDVESVTTETAANESLPKVTKSNSNLGKIQQAEVENNTEEPEKPAATRRGRVRKDISEVEPSRQPVKKGRGHKATETVEENDPVEEKSNENEGKEENIEKPLKKQRRRKIEVHTEEEELNNADKNEPPTEPKRSRRVVQQEKDIENISNKITTAKTNSKKTVTFKAAGESVSDDSTVVKNATENIDVARPRRTRAKRN
uniref:Uncharacterized protein n=1 Tax=Anopheles minimus TaxID=112268 RepID=A0A182WMX8_9DIPT